MEAPLLVPSGVGSSTELSNASVHSTSSPTTTTMFISADDDSRHAHFAVSASQTSKTMTGATSSPPPLSLSPPPSDTTKSLLTRFHEECHESETHGPRLRSSRMFKGKGKDALSIERETRRPLQLLDMPLDILKDIVKEVTHTNDLTSLALCHSALHRLAIPHIYSRFDIVWPDSVAHAEPRSGVDALTYGLATLVMAEEIFGESPRQREEQVKKENRFSSNGKGIATETAIRRRRGNHYAQFTKKFSLGNGPVDWVQEYLISKEGGKMLGTLVALALARMRALETFIWDMPTGILRDVWLALASLGEREDEQSCRLEKVWVRWHDNTSLEGMDAIPRPPPVVLAQLPPSSGLVTAHGARLQPPTSVDRVEHPSFSVLPPMKSLSVLDIDELAYLDEMAVLIGRSIEKLRELRVGIASHAQSQKWVTVWEGEHLSQVDSVYPIAGSATIGEKRLGGVLGVLTGFVCDVRKPSFALPDRTKRKRTNSRAVGDNATPATLPTATASSLNATSPVVSEQDPALTTALPPSPFPAEPSFASPADLPLSGIVGDQEPTPSSGPEETLQETSQPASHDRPTTPPLADVDQPPRLSHKLKLESLELERVPISVPVLQMALDWTNLTSLTLLNCSNHEQLWKTLRRSYAPYPKSPTYPQPRRTPITSPRKGSKASSTAHTSCPPPDLIFPLRLKKLHTNTVSAALISFLKDTLAPNSLEVLFLQETRSYASSVSIDAIFRGPLKRHRGSLTRLLIDSSAEKEIVVPGQAPSTSTRWRRWILPRDVLSFIVGGKMPALRELGVGIEYRDWHFFLQHLPRVKGLRSLYLPFLADHVHGNGVDPRELALQIVDIVALRPECEICYVGIAGKCFEILERKRGAAGGSMGDPDAMPMVYGGTSGQLHGNVGEEEADEHDEEGIDVEDDTESEQEDENEDDDDDDNDDDDDDDDLDEHEEDASEVEDGDEDGSVGGLGKLRLREILFYDDKVAVFKARHGRL